MKILLTIATLPALGLCPVGAFAQTAPVTVTAQMDQLKVFEGTWTCSGDQGHSLYGSSHSVETAVTGTADLGGAWIRVRYEENKTAENEHPTAGVYSYSYDPAAKQFVAIWTDSLGGWGTEISSGWQGGTMVLVGDYNTDGQKIGVRDTFQTTSAGGLNHVSELLFNGQSAKLHAERCHR